MVVLTVVDRFSKAAHFIPLPKLPSAKVTAVTVVDHVFRIHGSRWMWFPTGDPNLFPNFGKSSVVYWGRVSVCPLVFILRATPGGAPRRRGTVTVVGVTVSSLLVCVGCCVSGCV